MATIGGKSGAKSDGNASIETLPVGNRSTPDLLQDDDLFAGSVGSKSTGDEWDLLDIDDYMNSDGTNITSLFEGSEDIGILIDPLTGSTASGVVIADEEGVKDAEVLTNSTKRKTISEATSAKKKEGKSSSSNGSNFSSNSGGGNEAPTKRRRLTSLAASEKVYQFPAKLLAALNSGNMSLLEDIINDYCVDECVLNTKVVPEGMTGKAAIVTFFTAVYSSCPDMISNLTDLRLKRDRSIVMKGNFDATYVDDRNGEHDHLMFKKEKPILQEVSESRGGNKNRALSATEVQQLEHLDQEIKKNPSLKVATSGTYAARILFLSSKVGAAPGAPAHRLITRIMWDWKTLRIYPSNFKE